MAIAEPARRILVLSSTFPQYEDDPRGGFLRRHWERRARAGERVRVLVPQTAWCTGHLKTPLEITRFHYVRPSSLATVTGHFGIIENIRERPARALLVPLLLRGYRRALRAEIQRFRPDHVVAHMLLPCGWIVASECREFRLPYTLYGHGTDVDVALRIPRRLRGSLDRGLFDAERVYLPSAEKRARVAAALGLERAPDNFHVATMHESVSVSSAVQTSVTDKERRVLFVGRLIAQKGVDQLLRAAARMEPPPRVEIAGEGPERARLERLAARLKLNATFHGFVDATRRDALYASVSLLCVPSRERRGLSEGAPLVIVEAQRLGLSVVATRVGGIPELCAGHRDNTIVAPNDAAALASAMESTLAYVAGAAR